MKRTLPMTGKCVYAFLVLLLCCTVDIMAQDMKFATIKNFIPPSPDVAAFAKYGDIPVSYSTGIPDISIPLYEIKSRKLSLPLSLSYHASGFRPDEIPSYVGLGWVLNAGGMISRTVVGQADLEYGGFPDTISPGMYRPRSSFTYSLYDTNNGNDFTYLNNFSYYGMDTQADLFNFNVPSVAGRFMYDTKAKLHYMPTDRKLKFTRNSPTSYKLVDDNGTTYIFDATETTDTYGEQAGSAVTCWYLTKMISYDRTDSITFEYINAQDFQDSFDSYSFTLHVVPSDPNNSGLPIDMTPAVNASSTNIIYKRKLLSRIRFADGTVEAEYLNDRQDRGKERISKLVIKNEQGVIRSITFDQSYYAGEDKRLRLDRVNYKDRGESTIHSYSFSYDITGLPSYTQKSGPYAGRKTTAVDYWGFYNGNYGYTFLPDEYASVVEAFVRSYRGGMTDSYIMSIYNQNSGRRTADPSYTQAGILKKITYPTGGFTEFSYTNHTTNYTGEYKDLLGGLRIYAILNADPITGKSNVKTYSYDGAIAMANVIPDNFYYKQQRATYIGGDYHLGYAVTADLNILCNPISSFSYHNGSPAFYSKVSEYQGFPGMNIGKTVYEYAFDSDTTYGSDMEKNWDLKSDRSWQRGQLLNKKVYKNENNTYTLLHETKNYYADLGKESFCIGVISEPTWTASSTLANYLIYKHSMKQDMPLLSYFDYNDLWMTYGTKALQRTEEIDYANGTQTIQKSYSYDGNGHLYPTKIETTGSKPNEFITEIKKYPLDKNQIGGLSTAASAAIDGLVSLNVQGVPLESTTKVNNKTIQINRTDYKDFGAGIKIFPALLSQQNGDNPMEARVQYDSYDASGNPVSLRYVNGGAVSYIWDYNKSLLAANVKNAAENEIAFTSFETNDGGGWVYSGTPVAGAFAGNKSYDLNQGTVTRNSLNSSRNYIVSYWSKGTGVNVNGTVGKQMNTSRGWTRYEHILTNPATVTVSGNAQIDELRLHPVDAQMTSFTQVPMVGVTASATPNNNYSFFEYDPFGRLSVVRDLDGNIFKQYDYKYQDATGVSGKGNWQLVQSMNSYGVKQGEYLDINPNSPTYNSKAWMTTGLWDYYSPGWVPTGNKTCETYLTKPGNTGYVLRQMRDEGTFSSYFGSLSWQRAEYDEVLCPPPCDGEGQKKVNGVCMTGTQVYTQRYTVVTGSGKVCIARYHYEFSDGSVSQDYLVQYDGECPEDS